MCAAREQWLDGPGSGGPTYFGTDSGAGGQMRDAAGHLDRRTLLDRGAHTKSCKACSRVRAVLC